MACLTSSTNRGSFATWPSSSYPLFRLLRWGEKKENNLACRCKTSFANTSANRKCCFARNNRPTSLLLTVTCQLCRRLISVV